MIKLFLTCITHKLLKCDILDIPLVMIILNFVVANGNVKWSQLQLILHENEISFPKSMEAVEVCVRQ